MKRMMIVGCTSGIGKALAERSLAKGYRVGGLGRNVERLQELATRFPGQFFPKKIDLRDLHSLVPAFEQLLHEMGGMDVFVVVSSIALENPELQLEIEQDILQTNVTGYAAALIWASAYFQSQQKGHLVGITSLAKFLGSPNPAYTASKAFEGRYLDGLRLRLAKENITVTEIMPGFVRTPMTEGRQRMFWAISAEKAARCILKAIEKKKQKTVISMRWKPFYWILPHIPFAILKRLFTSGDKPGQMPERV